MMSINKTSGLALICEGNLKDIYGTPFYPIIILKNQG
jgi:hypothetical protein